MASSARIEELQKKFEENPRRYFAPLANEYRKAGDIDQAISICREYLPQQPGHMSGHIVYGQALYEARQFEEAKTVFETALSLDPENLIALRHLGDIALIVGDSDSARAWYRRVLEADPRNEEIQAQLATLDQSAEAMSSAPTPSSAPTLVVAAVKPPAAPEVRTEPAVPAEARPELQPTTEIVAQPPALSQPASAGSWAPPAPESLSTIPTSEIRVDSIPGAAPAAPPLAMEPTVPGGSVAQGAPGPESGSLSGLETTSFSESPAPSSSPPSAPASAVAPTAAIAAIAATAATPADVSSPLEAGAENASAPLTFLDLGEAPTPPASPQPAAPVPELLELDQPTANALPTSPQPVPPAPPEPAPQSLPMIDLGTPAALEPPPVPPQESGPFVTETMAELYLQQGHRAEALRVYRALLEQRPGDATLRGKVAALEAAAAPAQAPAPEAKKAAPPPAAPIPTIPAIPPMRAHRTRAGPTIREVLRVVAIRRPGSGVPAGRGNGAPPEPVAQATQATPAAPAAQPSSAPQARDAIAELFGGPQVSSADENAARALSFAFAGKNDDGGTGAGVTEVGGAPARRASNELSLDSVFKGDESGAPAAPSSFSFDQFFDRRTSTQQSSGTAPSGGANADSPDEVAHFTQWLEGLKQR